MARMSEAEFARVGLGKRAVAGSVRQLRQPSSSKGRERLDRIPYEEEAIEFEVPLPFNPRPKERPKTVPDLRRIEQAFLAARGNLGAFREMLSKGFSRTYTPRRTKDYEDLIAMAARAAMRSRRPLACPVDVSIRFVLAGDPGKWPTSSVDGDGDNLEKAVLDALNGIVFEDDRQVVRSFREKSCGPIPLVVVRVAPAAP